MRMRTPMKALAALAVGAAMMLTACSSPSTGGGDTGGGDTGDKPFKVVAFTSGNQTPVGAWFVKAVTAKAQELGWDLTMIQGDFDFQKMNPAVESAIGQGADAVLDGFTDYASIGSIVTAAKDADIPIFAIDSGTEPTDSFVYNVTTDQEVIVEQTLGAIQEAVGGSLAGKTVMVVGHDPHPGIRLRAELAKEALEKAGAIVAGGDVQKVTSPATGRTETLQFVADFLAANPGGLDAVWTGWDDSALGAVKAIEEAGSNAVVTGVDAVSEGVAAIEAGGPMLATVDQQWPSVLDMVIDAMVEYQKSGNLPANNFEAIKTVLVTKENAASITPSDKL